jgi:hypothetical protein
MIPARFALSAQADGWWLRSAIVWAKGVSFLPDYAGSCMPESVTDRPTQSYEMVYMLAKSPEYFFDNIAVQEKTIQPERIGIIEKTFSTSDGDVTMRGDIGRSVTRSNTRNLRSVWCINPQPYPGAHFACWPPALVEPMIKASTSQAGHCSVCGAGWKRVVEKTGKSLPVSERHGRTGHNGQPPQISGNYWTGPTTKATDTWAPSCSCFGHFEDVDGGEDWITEETGIRRKRRVYVPDGPQPSTVPATVLDPFCGSGTTLQVAVRLGRNAIGVDLSTEYLSELVPDRMDSVSLEPVRVTGGVEDWHASPLFQSLSPEDQRDVAADFDAEAERQLFAGVTE